MRGKKIAINRGPVPTPGSTHVAEGEDCNGGRADTCMICELQITQLIVDREP